MHGVCVKTLKPVTISMRQVKFNTCTFLFNKWSIDDQNRYCYD